MNAMKIIYNDYIPFHGYIAMNLFGFIFVRNEYKEKANNITLNHESIHTELIKELWYIPFYLLYILNYIFNIVRYGSLHTAYRNIIFEREAYENEKNLDYIKGRVKYACFKKKQVN